MGKNEGGGTTPMAMALVIVLLTVTGAVTTLFSFLGGFATTLASIIYILIGVVFAKKMDFGGIGKAGVTLIGAGLVLKGVAGFGLTIFDPNIVLSVGVVAVLIQIAKGGLKLRM